MTSIRDLQLKHLEIIGAAISRLAQNSFTVKGWSVTIASAIVAVTELRRAPQEIIVIVLLPTLIFWGLDAYYLRQERLFRKLYNHVAADINKDEKDREVSPLSMDTGIYKRDVKTWSATLFSATVWPVPVAVIAVIAFIMVAFR